MNKINISILANKLTNNKWLINQASHNSLLSLVNSYIINPYLDDNIEPTPTIPTNQEGDTNLTAIITVSGVLVKGCSDAE